MDGSLLTGSELSSWRGMLVTHSVLIAHLDEELEREVGIPLSAYEVLMYLGDADGGKLRMGELADRLLLSRSGITRLVDRLVRQGLIVRERCTDDGRGLYARLTPTGRRKLDRARPVHLAGVRRHFLAHLDESERASMGALWERILSAERRAV